jgi:hypothetical protein
VKILLDNIEVGYLEIQSYGSSKLEKVAELIVDYRAKIGNQELRGSYTIYEVEPVKELSLFDIENWIRRELEQREETLDTPLEEVDRIKVMLNKGCQSSSRAERLKEYRQKQAVKDLRWYSIYIR